jgi:hypothetical protein
MQSVAYFLRKTRTLDGLLTWRTRTNPGVIPIRFPAVARPALAGTVTRLVAELGPKLAGAFVVLRPGSVRISSIPLSE